jgi:hypothetical protein
VAKADPLAQLKDIHLPDPISWWPLAPGWYLLIAFIIFLFIVVMYQAYTRHRNALPKKNALQLLTTYRACYEKEGNAQWVSSQTSELLKRVALAYYPRANVANLCGEEWLNFLNQTAKGIDFNSVKYMLLHSPFKNKVTENPTPFLDKAEQWIKQRGTPCLN